jgi:hypothetical protein
VYSATDRLPCRACHLQQPSPTNRTKVHTVALANARANRKCRNHPVRHFLCTATNDGPINFSRTHRPTTTTARPSITATEPLQTQRRPRLRQFQNAATRKKNYRKRPRSLWQIRSLRGNAATRCRHRQPMVAANFLENSSKNLCAATDAATDAATGLPHDVSQSTSQRGTHTASRGQSKWRKNAETRHENV